MIFNLSLKLFVSILCAWLISVLGVIFMGEIVENKNVKEEFLLSKFDLINTWQGIILYLFILVLTLFILKRYFVLNVNVIEIQNIENQIIDK